MTAVPARGVAHYRLTNPAVGNGRADRIEPATPSPPAKCHQLRHARLLRSELIFERLLRQDFILVRGAYASS